MSQILVSCVFYSFFFFFVLHWLKKKKSNHFVEPGTGYGLCAFVQQMLRYIYLPGRYTVLKEYRGNNLKYQNALVRALCWRNCVAVFPLRNDNVFI